MKYNMICLVYVDDTIIYDPEKQAIDAEMKSLGVSSDEHRHKFGLIDEGEIGNFLGIIIENTGNSRFHFTHIGLIQKVPKMADIKEFN